MFHPHDSPEVQEALSRRYVAGVMVLKLSNGKYAIFNRAFELQSIVDRWDLTAKAIDAVPAVRPQVKQVLAAALPAVQTIDGMEF